MANDLQLSIELNKLSKPEQIALDHFKKKPEGRGFFAVAEILIRHERIEEAIQLLTEGLERHPHYSVARVYLSQLLFRKHFYREAWDALEASPSSLRTNLTAQILRL
ncbi:MAG: tetratricopeptide repeat protein, partial [Oligoflexus sp.]